MGLKEGLGVLEELPLKVVGEFSLCCDVHKLNHGVVCLELDDALDSVIQANK